MRPDSGCAGGAHCWHSQPWRPMGLLELVCCWCGARVSGWSDIEVSPTHGPYQPFPVTAGDTSC